jgi:hypothetical protein
LFPLGAKIFVTAKDDIDGLGGILELGRLRFVFLFLVFGLFARRLVLLAVSRRAKGALELKAVDRCVFGVDAPRALLLQDFFKLLLHGRLLAPRRMFHSRDEIVWLTLSGRTRKVPLAFVEAVDNVLVRDVGDGGPHIEETAGVGSEEFIALLLALGEVVPGSCSGYRPLEVADEDLLEAFPGVDGVVGESFQPSQRCRLQSHRKVDDFGSVGAASHLDGSGVTADPLLGACLPSYLVIPIGLKPSGYL